MIDKDIPIPQEFVPACMAWSKYPWRMCTEIGDSFRTDQPFETVEMARKKFCYRNKKFDFFVKQMDGYCRVWRVR